MSEETVFTLCINVQKFHLQEKVQIYLFILHNHEHIMLSSYYELKGVH